MELTESYKNPEIVSENLMHKYKFMEVRQAAAVALRKRCGGALYACGLCLDMLKEGIVC